MKRKLTLLLLLLSSIAMVSRAQSPKPNQESAQATQTRGYWIDPSTGLMWAGKDNGEDVNWKNAVKYCRNLRLAGYSDWKLPKIEELEGIYDGSGYALPPPSKGGVWGLAGKAKGGLLLTGNYHWSVNPVNDDRGHATGYTWEFDFPHGNRHYEPRGYYGSQRALCVHGPVQ